MLPITAGEEWLGIFTASTREENFFDEHKLHLYQTLAEQGAPALQAARLRAEIERSEKEYRELNAGLRDGVVNVDMARNIQSCNPAFEAMVGYSLEELKQISFQELTLEKWRALESRILEEQVLTRGYSDLYQKECIRKDGTVFPVELAVYLTHDEDGKPSGFWGFIRDITKRKDVERKVQESQKLLSDFVNNFPDVAFVKDREGSFILVNRVVTEDIFVGQDVIGKTVFDLFPPEVAEQVWSSEKKLLEDGEVVTVEEVGPQRDGLHTKLTTKFPLYDAEGNITGLGAICTDITKLKQVEQAMRESEEKFRMVADFTYAWEYWLGVDGDFVYVSPSCQRISGYSVDEFVQDPGLLATIIHPDDQADFERHVQEYHSEHNPAVGEIRFRIHTRDGEVRWIGHVCHTVHSDDGDWLGRRASNRDITVTKRLNEISRGLNQARDEEEIIRTLARSVIDAGADKAGLSYVELDEFGEPEWLVTAVMWQRGGLDGSMAEMVFPVGRRYRLADVPFADLWLSSPDQVQFVADSATDDKLDANMKSLLEQLGTRAIVFVPLHRAGLRHEASAERRWLGLLNFSWEEAHQFSAQEIEIYEALPALVAPPVANRRLLIEQERALTETLYRISRGLTRAADEDGILQALVQPAVKAGATSASLHYIELDPNGEPEWVETVAGWGQEGMATAPIGTRIPLARLGFSRLWIDNPGEPTLVADAASDERLDEPSRQLMLKSDSRAMVVIPLAQADHWVGIISFNWNQTHQFDERETEIYRALVDLAVPAVASRRAYLAEQVARAQTDDLYGISRGLSAATDVGQQLLVLARPAIEAGISSANLLYIDLSRDDELEWAEIVAQWQREGEPRLPMGSRFYLPEFPFADLWVASPDKAQLISDVTADEQVDENTGRVLAQGGARALVTIPLIQAGRWVGVITFGWDEPHQFTEQEAEIYNALIDLASPAVVGRRLMDDLERMVAERTEQLSTASDIAGQINAILDPGELLSAVVDQLHDRFGLYHVHVYLLEDVHRPSVPMGEGKVERELKLRAGYGEPGRVMLEQGHSIPFEREKSLVARAAREREIVLENDTQSAPDFMPNPLLPDTRSEAAVPLVVGDKVLGVFDVQDDEPGRFTPSEVDVFSTLAGQIATALQNAAFFEELQRTTERLRQVDRSKSDFMSSMSHEIRTPLNSIIGFAEVLLMGISGDLPPDAQEDVQAIYDNGQSLLKIINDILDLSKIEAGALTLNPEPIVIADLLQDVLNNNAGLLVDKPLEMLLEIEDDLPTLEADLIRMQQILNNLVSNAVKFTEQGAITLRAFSERRLQSPEQSGRGEARGEWICLQVQDTGIGISEEDLERVFERFEQVDGSHQRRAKGTGLGMPITRQLVELHGGTIDVSSKLGEGSTFSVRLPVVKSKA
jgi:PAS domain S-box-containing protein